MDTLGIHIILDVWGVKPELLREINFVQATMLLAAESSKVSILGAKFHQFEPEGVSGYVLIAESHISIHTWPANGYASLDIYTCGEKSFPKKAMEVLLKAFAPTKYNVLMISRGQSIDRMAVTEAN